MAFLTDLWLAILISAAIVFVASSIIHMVLPFHRSDYGRMPGEDDVRAAMRSASVAPGHYYLPHCASFKDMAPKP